MRAEKISREKVKLIALRKLMENSGEARKESDKKIVAII